MADKYRIVSENGLTRVYMPNGDELKNITSIKIEQNGCCGMFAFITIVAISPDVDVLAKVGNKHV